jgi:probable addiction module antidote protein
MKSKGKEKHINDITASYQNWVIDTLKDKEEATVYLQVALDEYQKDGNTKALLLALRNITKAQGGIGKLSLQTQLNRESLYRTLSSKGNPKLQTLGLLLKGLGFRLLVRPA